MKKFSLMLSAAAMTIAFDTCDTVTIKGEGGDPVRINASDFDESKHTLHKDDKEEQASPVTAGVVLPVDPALEIPVAPSAPNFAAAPEGADAPPAGPVAPTVPSPNTKLVMKDGKKYFVVDLQGQRIAGVEGIDADAGYASEALAQTAIDALPH